MKIISVVLVVGLLFALTGCNNAVKQNPQVIIEPQSSGSLINDEIKRGVNEPHPSMSQTLLQGIQKSQCIVTGDGSEDFALIIDNVDIDGDGIGDQVAIQSASAAKDHFMVTVKCKSETVEQEFAGDMWPESYYYCTDINGDGTAEIVFTNFSASSTADEANCAIIRYVHGRLITLPLSNDDTEQLHQWDLGSTDVQITDNNHVTLLDSFSGETYVVELSRYKVNDFTTELDGDISLYANNQYTLSCWIELLDKTKYGFRLNTFIEMQFENSIGTDTIPRAIVVISSQIYWVDGQWRLIDQDVMTEAEYYAASETYWNMMNLKAK